MIRKNGEKMEVMKTVGLMHVHLLVVFVFALASAADGRRNVVIHVLCKTSSHSRAAICQRLAARVLNTQPAMYENR